MFSYSVVYIYTTHPFQKHLSSHLFYKFRYTQWYFTTSIYDITGIAQYLLGAEVQYILILFYAR
jgi:hypothetical protein